MEIKVVYTCPKCHKRFAPDEVQDHVEEIEPGEYDYVCPNDGSELKWGLEICK